MEKETTTRTTTTSTTGTGPLGGAGTNTGGGTTTSSTGTGSGIGAAASQLGADLAAGAHKAAQAVGLEEKPTSTKLKEDIQNIGTGMKMDARNLGH